MQLYDKMTNVDFIAFFGKSVFLKGRSTSICFKLKGNDLKDKEILPFIERKS